MQPQWHYGKIPQESRDFVCLVSAESTEDGEGAESEATRENADRRPLSRLYQLEIALLPAQIWVLVPPIKISRSRRYRSIRTKTNLVIGIEDHQLYRMTSMERAIVEAFRYATKFGLETAIKSAQAAIRQQLTTPAKIAKQARDLGLESYITRYWEILITG